jgi:hypothetical protein
MAAATGAAMGVMALASAYNAKQKNDAANKMADAANQPSQRVPFGGQAGTDLLGQFQKDINDFYSVNRHNPFQWDTSGFAKQFGRGPGGGGAMNFWDNALREDYGEMTDPMNEVFRGSMDYQPKYFDDFIAKVGADGAGINPYLHDALGSLMGGQGLFGGGPGGGSSYSGGSGFGTPKDLGKFTNQFDQDIAEGKWLNANPHTDAVLETIGREGMEDLNKALMANKVSGASAGAFGGAAQALQNAWTNEEGLEAISAAKTGFLSDDYGRERGIMNDAQNRLAGLDQTRYNTAAQAASAGSAAGADRYRTDVGALLDMLGLAQGGHQFGLGTELDAILGLRDTDMMNLDRAGTLALGDQDYQLGLAGLGVQNAANRASHARAGYNARMGNWLQQQEMMRDNYYAPLNLIDRVSGTSQGATGPYDLQFGPQTSGFQFGGGQSPVAQGLMGAFDAYMGMGGGGGKGQKQVRA